MIRSLPQRVVPSGSEAACLVALLLASVTAGFGSPTRVHAADRAHVDVVPGADGGDGAARDPIFTVERRVLPNGLQIWVKERETTRAVEVRVVIRVGFRDEAPLDSGISHFLEHMLFKGTETRDEAELKRVLTERGASWNGTTTPEFTRYYVNILDRDFTFALDWLTDILLHSRIDSSDVDAERKVVYAEQGGRYPRFVEEGFQLGIFQPLSLRLIDAYFPWAELPERSIAQLDHVGAPQLRAHWEHYYVPDNMAVLVVGHVDADSAFAAVEERLGRLPARPVERPHALAYCPPRDPAEVGEVRTVWDPVLGQTSRVQVGIWTRGWRDPDRYALRVLEEHLRRRLKEEIRYQRALSYSVGVDRDDYSDVGYVAGYAETERSGGKEHEAREILDRVVAELRDAPLTQEEVDAARQSLVGRMARAYENNSHLASLYEAFFIQLAPEEPVPDQFALLEAVTPADVQRVARERFAPGAMFVAVAHPLLSYVELAILVGVLVVLIVGSAVLRSRRRKRRSLSTRRMSAGL